MRDCRRYAGAADFTKLRALIVKLIGPFVKLCGGEAADHARIMHPIIRVGGQVAVTAKSSGHGGRPLSGPAAGGRSAAGLVERPTAVLVKRRACSRSARSAAGSALVAKRHGGPEDRRAFPVGMIGWRPVAA